LDGYVVRLSAKVFVSSSRPRHKVHGMPAVIDDLSATLSALTAISGLGKHILRKFREKRNIADLRNELSQYTAQVQETH